MYEKAEKVEEGKQGLALPLPVWVFCFDFFHGGVQRGFIYSAQPVFLLLSLLLMLELMWDGAVGKGFIHKSVTYF